MHFTRICMRRMFLFLLLYAGAHDGFAQLDFDCNYQPPDTSGAHTQDYVGPKATGNVNAIAIFARFNDPNPNWNYGVPWDSMPYNYESVLKVQDFMRQSSLGKHNIRVFLLYDTAKNAPIMGDTTFHAGGTVYDNISTRFVKSMLDSLDALYDFGQFDNDGPDSIPNSGDDDGYVDFTMLNIIYPLSRGGTGLTHYSNWDDEWTSRDTCKNGSGGHIKVSFSDKAAIQQILYYPDGNYYALPIHEYGHSMGGLPDIDHSYLDCLNHYGLGAFDIMSGGFRGEPSVFNPRFRIERLHWLTPDTITSNVSDLQMTDLLGTGKIFEVLPTIPSNALTGEKFWITYHNKKSGYLWERYWPVKPDTGGVLIWHTTGSNDWTDSVWARRRPPVAIEAAHGRYIWLESDSAVMNTGVKNALTGLDSLEIRKLWIDANGNHYEIEGPYYKGGRSDSIRGGKHYQGGTRFDAGDSSFFFIPNNSQDYAFYTNPTSNLHVNSASEWYGRSVTSGMAMKNLHRSIGDTVVYADIYVHDRTVSTDANLDSGKWYIKDTVIIPAGKSLTLQGGNSVFSVDQGKSFQVYGTLNVNTSGNSITNGKIQVHCGGSLVMCPSSSISFMGDVTVDSGGSWKILRGSTCRFGNHLYGCAGTLTIEGDSTKSPLTDSLILYETTGLPTIHILNHGKLLIKPFSVASLNVNIEIQSGGRWEATRQTNTTLYSVRTYKNYGTIAFTGDGTHTAVISSDTLWATIYSGSQTANAAQVWVDSCDVTNLCLKVQKVAMGRITNSIFRTRWNNRAADYSCIALYDLLHLVDVTGNSFAATMSASNNSPSHHDVAVSVHDNIGTIEGITYNTISGYRIGIELKQAVGSVSHNTISNVTDGIVCLSMANTTRIQRNTISSLTGAGIFCNTASPWILGNTISTGSNGVVASISTPFLGCNNIHDNNQAGVAGFTGSLVNMGLDFFSQTPARNHIVDNHQEQLWYTGKSIDANWGNNEISVDGRGALACNPVANALLAGVQPGNGAPIQAAGNYWGTLGNNNPPLRSCGWFRTPGNVNFFPIAPAAPSSCTDNDLASYGTFNCTYFTDYFNNQSGFFNDACDSLLAKYNMDINCGNCADAVNDLLGAIVICDPGDSSTLVDLLERVHRTFLDCHNRDVVSLAGLAQWMGNYSVSTTHDANRIPARWMQGVAYGLGQFFDAAIAIFDSISALNLAIPYDSASCSAMSDMYSDMREVEGGYSMAKATQSGGRFGDVVMPSNPIDLTIYPNPAMMGSRPTVQYTIPVEDANDVAEVRVWDINGNDVSTLVHDIKAAGRYEVTFDGTKLATGRYIVAVHLRTHQQSKMVNLVR